NITTGSSGVGGAPTTGSSGVSTTTGRVTTSSATTSSSGPSTTTGRMTTSSTSMGSGGMGETSSSTTFGTGGRSGTGGRGGGGGRDGGPPIDAGVNDPILSILPGVHPTPQCNQCVDTRCMATTVCSTNPQCLGGTQCFFAACASLPQNQQIQCALKCYNG